MSKDDWIWMPHPGHLIVSRNCRFHLNTYVGGYIVSTVGEYWPGGKDVKMQTIGIDRYYETMVFPAIPDPDNPCCPYAQQSGENVDFEGYNSPSEAVAGHLRLCEEWSRKEANE